MWDLGLFEFSGVRLMNNYKAVNLAPNPCDLVTMETKDSPLANVIKKKSIYTSCENNIEQTLSKEAVYIFQVQFAIDLKHIFCVSY